MFICILNIHKDSVTLEFLDKRALTTLRTTKNHWPCPCHPHKNWISSPSRDDHRYCSLPQDSTFNWILHAPFFCSWLCSDPWTLCYWLAASAASNMSIVETDFDNLESEKQSDISFDIFFSFRLRGCWRGFYWRHGSKDGGLWETWAVLDEIFGKKASIDAIKKNIIFYVISLISYLLMILRNSIAINLT